MLSSVFIRDGDNNILKCGSFFFGGGAQAQNLCIDVSVEQR